MNRFHHRGAGGKPALSAAVQQNTRGAKRARSIHKAGVFRRLLINFLSIGLVPITVLAILAIVYSTRVSLTNIKTGLLADTELAGSLLDAELQKYQTGIEQFRADNELIAFLKTENPSAEQITQLNQKLYLIMAGRTDQLRMHVANAAGEIILSTGGVPREYQYQTQNWGVFRAMRASNAPIHYAGSYTLGDRARDTGITVCAKVLEQGETVGFLLLDIPKAAIESVLSSANAKFAVRYLVFDANDFLIYNDVLADQGVFLQPERRAILQDAAGGVASYEIDGERMMISAFPLSSGETVAASVSVDLMVNSANRLTVLVIAMVALIAVFLVWQSRKMAERIVKPIETICEAMSVIERGDWERQVTVDSDDEFATMAHGINHMVAQLNEQFRTNLERQDRLRLAEYKNLQAQISPHFLSNTLECIKWLARLGQYDEIQTIVEKLGVLLKSGMVFKKEMIAFGDELSVVESYLTIQKIRYRDKFSMLMSVPDELLDCLVPNLVIQPIVENAIVHGVEKKRGHITLAIRAEHVCDMLVVTIMDDGAGIPAERLERILSDELEQGDRESIGLKNVHNRLKLYFGEPYGIRIESARGKGTTVTVHMPYRRAPESPG
ncbi:MAG TPA: sensor histidine kinase [Feifaniaceae bacterium]|nr:sensor histidine kinase [Feifaniaceae bacterium]